jgi:hypothetical protein
VAKVLKNLFPDVKLPEVGDFIVLSASSNTKESLRKTKNDKGRAKECFVVKGPDEPDKIVPFVDMVIYHHKSCFRMYKCTKTGSFRPLEIDPEFPLPSFITDVPEGPERDRLIFRYTVPSAVPPGTTILSVNDDSLIKEILPKKAFKYDIKKAEKIETLLYPI